MDRRSARIKAELERYGWKVSKKFKYRKGKPIKVYDKLAGLTYEMDLETARANYPNRLERLEEERLMDMPFDVSEPQVEGHDGLTHALCHFTQNFVLNSAKIIFRVDGYI